MDDDAKLSTLLMELYHAEGRPQVLALVDELKDAGALAKPTVVTSMLNARQLRHDFGHCDFLHRCSGNATEKRRKETCSDCHAHSPGS